MSDHEEHHEESAQGHPRHAKHGGGHGGGAHEEHEGAPEWLISFADNVALLMGFFVILLAMNMKAPQAGGIGGKDGPNSPKPSKQWLDLVIAIREEFHSPVRMDSTDPRDAALRQRLLERENDASGESIRPGPDGGKTNPQAIEPSHWVERTAVIPFEYGTAELSESTRETARNAARKIGGNLNIIIEVRGHVSAQEAQRNQERAFQLSYERALTIAKVLTEEGVPRSHIRLVACADSSPQKPRADTFADHHTNQRVELVINQERPQPDQFSDESPQEPPKPEEHK